MGIQTAEDQAHKPWHSRVSPVEKKMIHLARAFIMNPRVMALHKPFDDLEDDWAVRILKVLKDFVSDEQCHRSKRTAFISVGTVHMRDIIGKSADVELIISVSKA